VNATEASFFLRIAIAMLIGSVLEFFIEPIQNLWSRKHEWQADTFAVSHVPNRDLQSALIKLAKDNLANLHMHPWYVAYHASHPTLPARVARLDQSIHASEHQLESARAVAR
jgi:STE24 endopeptidase